MILRDSIDPYAIPLDNLDAVAGYGDGVISQWTSAGWARFPDSVVPLVIVVRPGDIGDILDVENGDATPADVPGWVRRFSRPWRRRPTIYSNRQTWPDIVKALQAAGLSAASVDWWAATLDGTTDVPGAVAVQSRGSKLTGGNYDESVVLDPGWIGMEADVANESALDPLVQEDRDFIRQVAYGLFVGQRVGTSFDAAGTPTVVPEPQEQFFLRDRFDQVDAEIKALAVPQLDAEAIAASLAANTVFVQALASAIVHKIGAAAASAA